MSERKKTVSKIAAALFCLLAAAMATSCGSMGSHKDQDTLQQCVEAFNRAFKWEDYNGAAVWVDRGRREQFWREVDNFKKKIKIVDFQIREIQYQEKAPTGTAIISFQYWRPDAPTLQTATISQKWFFSPAEKAWQVGQSGYYEITKSPTGF
jgi:hypothetical protein